MVKKSYTDFSFKTFRSEIKFHTNPGLSQPIFEQLSTGLPKAYKRSGCNSCSGSLNVHKQDTIHSQFQSSSPHTGVNKGASKLSERPDKMLMGGGGVGNCDGLISPQGK